MSKMPIAFDVFPKKKLLTLNVTDFYFEILEHYD